MPVSIFGQLLVSERRNMRMPEKLEASIRSGVSSRPILNEVPVEEGVEPLLSTNAAGRFVLAKRSSTRGVARYGFSEVPLDAEPALLAEFYMTVLDLSLSKKWPNRCNSVADAVDRMRELELEPSFMVVSEEMIPNICGPDYDPEQIEHLMMTQGYVAEVDEIKVLPGNLDPDSAIVTATPAMVGLYTRVADYLGIMVHRVDQTVMVVGDGVA